jgi:exocyst complex component 4
MESFRRTKSMLSKSLKSSVDSRPLGSLYLAHTDPFPAYYQAFAQSLPQHSTLFGHMDLSQSQVKEARTALLDAKEALGNKRADLVQIWSRGQTIEEMMRIIDQM